MQRQRLPYNVVEEAEYETLADSLQRVQRSQGRVEFANEIANGNARSSFFKVDYLSDMHTLCVSLCAVMAMLLHGRSGTEQHNACIHSDPGIVSSQVVLSHLSCHLEVLN